LDSVDPKDGDSKLLRKVGIYKTTHLISEEFNLRRKRPISAWSLGMILTDVYRLLRRCRSINHKDREIINHYTLRHFIWQKTAIISSLESPQNVTSNWHLFGQQYGT
jgi:hypothetical protein